MRSSPVSGQASTSTLAAANSSASGTLWVPSRCKSSVVLSPMLSMTDPFPPRQDTRRHIPAGAQVCVARARGPDAYAHGPPRRARARLRDRRVEAARCLAKPRRGSTLAAEPAVVQGLGPAHPRALRRTCFSCYNCYSYPIWTVDTHLSCRLQEHGLRDLPTAVYPDKHDGVTLKCPKEQEVVRLPPLLPPFLPSSTTPKPSDTPHPASLGMLQFPNRARPCVPLPAHPLPRTARAHHLRRDQRLSVRALLAFNLSAHVLPGSRRPEFIHEDVLTVAAKGRYTTVSRVAGAGHLVRRLLYYWALNHRADMFPRYHKCSPRAWQTQFGPPSSTTP
jgi:hypothetical protein